ncbi:MAG: two-component regulator propeller domain-containing protein [Verrucomicrobiota bacterium]
MLFLGTALTTPGLDPARNLSQYNLRTWTRQNGLPANAVRAIAQSREGYLWLGTPAGLVRFDGVDFQACDMSKLRSSIVTSLAPASGGGVWFGLESGSFGRCEKAEPAALGRTEWGGSNVTVHALAEGADGSLWVAAQNLAWRLPPGPGFEALLNTPGGKDFYDVGAVLVDSQGRCWMGTTSRGLFYWENGVRKKFPDPVLDDLTVRALAQDSAGRLWIGTHMGVLCYDAQFRRQPLPFPWHETRALLADREGAVWAGTSGAGLVRFANGNISALQQTNGLTDNFVDSLAEDLEGNLWVGTRNGLNQLSEIKIPTCGRAEGLHSDILTAVAPSARGGLWVASGDGFFYFDNTNATGPGPETALHNRYLKRVHESRNGDLYLLNGDRDIEVVSGGKVVARYSNDAWPTAMTEDAQGVIVAVGGDLYRVGTNYFTPLLGPSDAKPLRCWMYNILAARDGSIWTASAEGICRLKDGGLEQITGPDPFGGARANCLCEDADGTIWAGLETGVARIRNGEVRVISREHGLLDNLIFAIVPDDFGNLWMQSSRGFFQVSSAALNRLADGHTDYIECAAYDGLEAVKTYDRNQQENVGCRTGDGCIWFPTAQGVVRIDPARIPVNRVPPQVYVHRARSNGDWSEDPDTLRVRPGRGDLEFDYTAISFVAPQKIRFRYRLEGYDRDWTEAGDRRQAFYTNLKPGRYVFRVIAANADGIWNTVGDIVEVELLPHYYQTLWFRALTGALAAFCVLGLYAWRIRHLHWKQQALLQSRDLLERKVAERTTELAHTNTSLTREIQQRTQTQAELERQKTALEREIEERKRMQAEVEQTHQQLLEISRRAGQAEVASGVLHNVGNVLNSVNVSTAVVADRIRNLQVPNLVKASQILEQHEHDLARFLTEDPKGRKLPVFFQQLAQYLEQEQRKMLGEMKELSDNIEHIKEIVAMQQAYTRVSGTEELLPLSEIVENALRMQEASCGRHGVEVVRDFQPVPPASVDRHKALQILVNVLQNARQACIEGGQQPRRIHVRLRRDGPAHIALEIQDNGIGIPPENLTRIFSHGFTTRPHGHGFGLHSAALAAREMGGTLGAASGGPGMGATFTLTLPVAPIFPRSLDPLPAGSAPSRRERANS